MSKKRLIPLPLKGLDARSSVGIPQETLSSVSQIRVTDQAIRRGPNIDLVSIGGPSFSEIARNLIHAFYAGPGNEANQLILLTTHRMATYESTAWVTRETGYNVTATTFGPAQFHPRFAWANSAHRLVWTMSEATPHVKIRVFDGAVVTVITPDYSARHLIAYNKRIVVADTLESGSRNASRIRWSANGNFLDWTGLGSGFLEIGSNTSSGRITAFNNFDEIAVVSLQNEFIELLPTGSLFPVFELGAHHAGVGVAAPRTWQVWNHTALFMGPDNVYAWDRQKFTAIGDPVAPRFRPYLYPERMMAIQGIVLPARGEYHLLLGSGPKEGDADAYVLIYDVKADRWFEDRFSSMSALGRITYTISPNAFTPRAYFDSLEFLVATGETDYVLLERSWADTENTNAAGSFSTQDFFALDGNDVPAMGAKNELVSLTFRTRPNTSVNVSVSVDKGATNLGATLVTANAEGVAAYHFLVAFSQIRFNFAQQNGQKPLMIEGPWELEWERVGDTY